MYIPRVLAHYITYMYMHMYIYINYDVCIIISYITLGKDKPAISV